MNLYRVIAEDITSGELSEINVMAEGTIQHIWNKTNAEREADEETFPLLKGLLSAREIGE